MKQRAIHALNAEVATVDQTKRNERLDEPGNGRIGDLHDSWS